VVKNGKKVPLRNKLYADWYEQRYGARDGAGIAEKAVDYLPQLIADESLKFIRKNAEKPFFMYYALNIPHANNEGGGEARIDRDGMRVPGWGEFGKRDWPNQEKGFAQMIHYIDRDIGNIIRVLKELDIDDNTILMFSSDNGPHQEGGHKMSFFDSNGSLRGMKRDLYEGGIRVPFIARWPGKIAAGKNSSHISGFQDVFPTVCELAGIKTRAKTDGISFAPTLLGRSQKAHPHLYWEFYERGGKAAVVKGKWKGVRLNIVKNPDAPIELFDLSKDVGEQHNVAAQHPELVRQMARIMAQQHVEP
jgi:arylsulfatase A-like enzyme